MAREHDDLIDAAKAAPDIETSLEVVLNALLGRWNYAMQREDMTKAQAMTSQITTDIPVLIDAIMNHPRVFKAPPVKVRGDKFAAVPKTATKPVADIVDKWSVVLTFTGPVDVLGQPVLELSDGHTATYESGTGTSALTFADTKHDTSSTANPTVTKIRYPVGSSIKVASGKSVDYTDAIVSYPHTPIAPVTVLSSVN